jgi:hypothetical protein
MALPVSHCGKSIPQEAYKSLGTGYRIRGNVREVNAEEASEEEGRAGVGMKVKLHFGSSSSDSLWLFQGTRQEAAHWKQ